LKTGIFGGTFNPVHLGHLIMAQDALERHELDEVIWMPCYTPPHKSSDSLPSIEHRVRMLDMALEEDYRMSWSDMEIKRGGTSYTIDTVEGLMLERPHDELFFIIGADTLFELHTWRRIDELLEKVTFITLARHGFEMTSVQPDRLNLTESQTQKLKPGLTASHLISVSSTDLRLRIAEGLSIQYLVPRAVELYIMENHLYQD